MLTLTYLIGLINCVFYTLYLIDWTDGLEDTRQYELPSYAQDWQHSNLYIQTGLYNTILPQAVLPLEVPAEYPEGNRPRG